MSSANEHFPPPPKPRMSPLDFRNTDLVSRLLAATPPYLYNMSLLPNTFFFSEMLRSFVQAKAEHNKSTSVGMHTTTQRRSRKRTWSSSRAECLQKQQNSPKPAEKPETNDWMLKSNHYERKSEEIPLELTINKIENNSDGDNKPFTYPPKQDSFNTKSDLPLSDPMFPLHSGISGQDNSASTNLVLPPPPPMWYPPLYPAPPYGIDPLHFFIDLRVSGHIYDRKNQKDSPLTPPSTIVSPLSKDKSESPEHSDTKAEEQRLSKDFFKQPRHVSAFSVPVPSSNKSSPINLSHLNPHTTEHKQTKFDVKSMGLDKNSNKTSTNYILNHIGNIYNNVNFSKEENIKHETSNGNNGDENKEKKVKDLKTLLGLDFVVDYMNHSKPSHSNSTIDSNNSTDVESIGSPTLEVVAVNDDS